MASRGTIFPEPERKIVPGTGIEPARPKGHCPLKTARLPIPPPGLMVIPPGLEPGTL